MQWVATKKDLRTFFIKLVRGDKSSFYIVLVLIGLTLLVFKTRNSSVDVTKRSTRYKDTASYDSMHICRKGSDKNITIVSTTGVKVAEEVFLFIEKPLKSFHSDHWFHLGEYFVGWRTQVRQQIEQHCSKYQANYGNTCLQRRSFKLVIIANQVSFVKHFTKMTLFLILLSVSVNEETTFSHVSLYGPVKHHKHCLRRSNEAHYGYSDCYSFGKRFVTYSKDSSSGKYTYKFQHDSLQTNSVIVTDYHVYNPRYTNSTICNPDVNVLNLKIGREAKSSYMWFEKDTNDSARLRDALNIICAGVDHDKIKKKEVKYLHYTAENQEERNVVIYDRNDNRKIAQLSALIDKLMQLLSSSSFSKKLTYNIRLQVLVHDEHNDPCGVYRLLNAADLFLTPHGFQSTGILFMKPGASLLEIFPYKYHKESYHNLSKSFDVKYHYLQNKRVTSYNRANLYLVSQKRCMDSYKCRRYARGDHVHVTQSDVTEIVEVIVNL